MKIKKALFSILVFVLIVTVLNTAFLFKDIFFYNSNGSASMESLPKGEFMYSSICEYNENFVVRAYVVKQENLGEAVRAEIVYVNEDKVRTCYWQNGTTSITVSWNSANTVVINGRKINVENGYYDARS